MKSVSRQVSHPNVCRVYDIGFIEGFHFLSMEYLDGEDLASLLRRIGRLAQDKAIEFTRKICAGLAAAHERGVLHRDLKPANIMIDGRGQVRITDFGLAALAQEVALGDIRSGTPAYMSPEQKAGKEVSIRSDLYSLGLVLYEMFTGKRRSDTQTNPSEHVKDLDPAVERVILRCLEQDPKRRPSSALSVAMALPGGDPIAAALAAGETPSPEMVAASSEKEGFSARTAWLCFAAIVILAIPFSLLTIDSRLLRTARLDIPPEALAFKAQEILKQFGYTETPKSTSYGFDCCNAANLASANRLSAAQRDALLASHQPPVISFWYRQHQDVMFAEQSDFRSNFGSVTSDSPPNSDPGMIRVSLDAKGRLIELDARPADNEDRSSARLDWTMLFSAAGLDMTRFKTTAPEQLPPMPFDARAAWIGTYAEGRSERVRVEAAAWQGRPVYFAAAPDGEKARESTSGFPAPLIPFVVFLFVFVIVGAALVARHNLRAGRGDRHGAMTVAVVSFLAGMCSWTLTASHVARPWELQLLFTAIAGNGLVCAVLWLAYIAVEPYMRRYWPESLISWSRVLSGRFKDALVASHLLMGVFIFYPTVLLWHSVWLSLPMNRPEDLGPLNSPAYFAAFIAGAPGRMLDSTVVFLVIVVVWRLIARRRLWIADILSCAFFGLLQPIDLSTPYYFSLTAVTAIAVAFVMLWLIRRFGFLAVLGFSFPRLIETPFVWGSWYAGRGMVAQLIPIAIAAWAVWVIVSAQKRPATETAS